MAKKQNYFIGIYNYTVIATFAALAIGTLGITLAICGRVFAAVMCMVTAGALDMIDGVIAQSKKDRTEKEKLFGIQIDSLCDLVSFGVLPAVIGVSVGMTKWYHALILIAYVLCAQIRLSYYNVDEILRQQKTMKKRKSYAGLPVTTIAIITPVVYAIFGAFGAGVFRVVFTIVLALAAIMFILNVKVPKLSIKSKPMLIMLGVSALSVLCLIIFKIVGLI